MTNPKKYADVRTNPNILLSKQSLDIEIDTWNDKQPDIQKDKECLTCERTRNAIIRNDKNIQQKGTHVDDVMKKTDFGRIRQN